MIKLKKLLYQNQQKKLYQYAKSLSLQIIKRGLQIIKQDLNKQILKMKPNFVIDTINNNSIKLGNGAFQYYFYDYFIGQKLLPPNDFKQWEKIVDKQLNKFINAINTILDTSIQIPFDIDDQIQNGKKSTITIKNNQTIILSKNVSNQEQILYAMREIWNIYIKIVHLNCKKANQAFLNIKKLKNKYNYFFNQVRSK